MLTISVELNGVPLLPVTVGLMDQDALLSCAALSAALKVIDELSALGSVTSVRVEVLVVYPVHTSGQ